jgi:hypothetical protein
MLRAKGMGEVLQRIDRAGDQNKVRPRRASSVAKAAPNPFEAPVIIAVEPL